MWSMTRRLIVQNGKHSWIRLHAETVTLGEFLQRSFGLALSADQSEQAIWIHYGTGSNGKGTLLSIVDDILGNYARTR